MAVVNFRVDEGTKKKMDRLRHLNWSELLRQYVRKVVEMEEKKFGESKDYMRMKSASALIDELRARSSKGWRGAEVVIQWRKLRR